MSNDPVSAGDDDRNPWADPSRLAAAERAVVGRGPELRVAAATLSAAKNLLLEGPPGTGKSTLLRTLCTEVQVGFEFVEGNAELTPARLLGSFNPALVLERGYTDDCFIPGPLYSAAVSGSVLYLEELNRIPEETLNVLITAIEERELNVPRLGSAPVAPGFRVVAAMNPFDHIGTGRLPAALLDRFCRIGMSYQSREDETAIVNRSWHGRSPDTHQPVPSPNADSVTAVALDSLGDGDGSGGPDVPGVATEPLVTVAVNIARATRDHPDLRSGSSVRGAIDMIAIAAQLDRTHSRVASGLPNPADRDTVLPAALAAFSGRIRVRENSSNSAEKIVEDLWESAVGALTRENTAPDASGKR